MKRLLITLLCFLSLSSVIIANEKEDSLKYYFQQFKVANDSGDIQDACVSLKNTLRIYKEIDGDVSIDTVYASIASVYAVLCDQLGDYDAAVNSGTEVVDIYKHYGTNNVQYASAISRLALFYSDFGNFNEAIRLETETMGIYQKVTGTNSPEYASCLFSLAGFFYEIGNYNEAVRLGLEAADIRKKILGPNHPSYAASLGNLAMYYSSEGNYNEAIRLENEVIEINKTLFGTEHPNYATSLNNLARFYYNSGNYHEAIRLETKALEIIKKTLGTENQTYSTFLDGLAGLYAALGDYDNAISHCIEAKDIKKRLLGTRHPDYATSLNNLATYYGDIGNFSQAIQLGTEAMEIRKNVLGTNHPFYATSLSNLSSFYQSIGQFDEAVQFATEALEIKKKVLGTDHPDYAKSLNNLAALYSSLGEDHEAIRLGTEVTELRKRILGTNHPDYAMSLNNLAGYYSDIGDYNQAILMSQEATNIIKNVFGTEHPGYAKSLANLALRYYMLGNFDEAIRQETEAKEIRKRVLGSNHPEYATSLNNLAMYYSNIGEHNKAIRLGSESMEIRMRVLGAEHPDYAMSLNNLASCYFSLGNYNEAIQFASNALEVMKHAYGTNHREYATTLSNLALYNAKNGDYYEAIRLGTEAMGIRKNVIGTNHPNYALSLDNLAMCYSIIGDDNEAIRLESEAMDIRKRLLGENHPDYATSLNNLATCYYNIGNYDEAIRLSHEAKEIRKRALGANHIYYAISLGNLAYDYSALGDYNKAITLFREYISIIRTNVLHTFLGITAKERQLYWNQFSFALNQWIPEIFTNSGKTEAASILYDNTALFAKGLLLSTELEMAKLIQESGDTEALHMYTELRQNRQILNAQYSKPISERYLNCDSLERVSNDLERDLVSRVKEFGDYTRNLSITWQDVQGKLNDDDIAVEFLSYQKKDGGTSYAALTLCKNDTAPALTPLFDESKLLEVSAENDTYQTGAADSLIWEPLSSRLEGKSKVYFSASGMMHNIGIEYFPSMDGKDCYRLSSTRELVTHMASQPMRSATLYGDIDYDATYASIESYIPSAIKNYAMNGTSQYRGIFDYRSLNNGYGPLSETRVELDEVAALIKPLGVPCDTLTGIQASEESFKALSGQHRSLLHISTHGFYYNDEKAQKLKPHLRQMLLGEDRPLYAEDRSLLRCGLCFAGANQTLLGKSQPSDGQDDGILNALEIAQTDLRGLDLVVLSACQTALGDIAQGEGVFGLQRGFKKAGAKSILMSLWNVDDLTTQLLMVEFYRNYLSGKSKHESLRKAQQYVRDYRDENGNKLFDDPHYWAGFILLDALD